MLSIKFTFRKYHTEVSFHVDVSALVGSKLFTKIPLILTLRGPERQILLPQGEFKELYLAGSCSINKKSRVFLVDQSTAQKHLSAS